ncbi:MAG: PucR family transcriptional regulator [Coriobacteriales bacterium]|jgi:sugar diacid utilization regulator
MLISMDVLAHELGDSVVEASLLPDTGLTLSSFQVLDGSRDSYDGSLVYLAVDAASAPLGEMPAGSNIIVVDGPLPEEARRDDLNIIVLEGLSPFAVVNAVTGVFQKYIQLDERLTRAFAEGESLQVVLDIITEIIQVPVCMLDLNNCVLAQSTVLEPEGDALWDAMVDGYGYRYYSIIEKSIPRVNEMDERGEDLWDGINNVSGRRLRVYLLRRGGKGLACFGMHSAEPTGKPYERFHIQLAEFAIERIVSHLGMFKEVKLGRGKLSEQFLTDLLDGESFDEASIAVSMNDLGIANVSRYYLGLVLFKQAIQVTDYDFALMDYIEAILPECRCAMYQRRLVFFCPAEREGGADSVLQRIEDVLPGYLARHDCFCLLSSPFDSMAAAAGVYRRLVSVIPYLRADVDDQSRVHHYFEYSSEHALSIFAREVPLREACHPALVDLVAYDRENNTEYYDTLIAYLRHGCDVSATASELHVHRNSLYYRIDKLKKLLGVDYESFGDWAPMLFSVSCMEFLNRHGDGAGSPGDGSASA